MILNKCRGLPRWKNKLLNLSYMSAKKHILLSALLMFFELAKFIPILHGMIKSPREQNKIKKLLHPSKTVMVVGKTSA